jgi:hypothetical protein
MNRLDFIALWRERITHGCDPRAVTAGAPSLYIGVSHGISGGSWRACGN